MSFLRKHADHDAEERRAAIREASRRLEDTKTDPRGFRLIELADYLRTQNERNHYAQRLQAAYGKE